VLLFRSNTSYVEELNLRQYHFYHEATGLLSAYSLALNVPDGHDELVSRNCPSGHKAIEGHLHPSRHRVDVGTGKVVDYQPPAPSVDHEWDEVTQRWQLNAAALAKVQVAAAAHFRIRELRDSQHDIIRAAVLGDRSALDQLRSIDTEISELSRTLNI
jgi:hypothetical protein